ncbi:hypothetical protein BJX76DRAFT_340188, partial [Aspergillus varians]
MACHLPFDIWNQICLRLVEDGSRHDLSVLSQINRMCYAAASPVFYKSLTIMFWDINSLEDTLSQLNEDRLGHRYLRYTRELCLVCLSGPPLHKEDGWRMEKSELISYVWPAEHLMPHWTYGHDIGFRFFSSHHDTWAKDWKPVASLISRLQDLERLDFYARDQFPVALQNAILDHQNCQLNVFCPQILGHATHQDPISELGVLRVPGLHTLAINLTWAYRNLPGFVNLNEMLPVIFVAPNLKRLVLQSYPHHRFTHVNPWGEFNREWRNLAARIGHTPSAALEAIVFSGPHESVLLRLAETGNLSSLRSLDIKNYFEPALLREIATMFPRLKQLFIDPNPRSWQSEEADNEDAIAAIMSFAPLEFVCLRGLQKTSSLFKILEQHGRSLETLILEVIPNLTYTGNVFPEFNASDIETLTKYCPNVQDLRLPITRSKGNKAECNKYKALGGFERMNNLVLDLHFDPRQRPIGLKSISESIMIKETFINAAMDENLAREILSLIASNQPSHRLKALRLLPFGLPHIDPEGSDVLEFFAKPFLASRSPLRVQKIAREEQGLWREDSRMPGWLDRLLYEIWPSGPGECGWMSGSYSVPLDVNGGSDS